MIKVFLENLPKSKYGEEQRINWRQSVGEKVFFIFNDIKGYMTILSETDKEHICVEYNNNKTIILKQSLIKNNIRKILNIRTKEFKIEIGQTFKDDKRDITIIDRKYRKDKNGHNRKYYKYKCNKCGFDCGKHWNIKDKCYKHEHWILENNLLSGNGCASCCPNSQIIVKGINDIATTHPNLIKYFVNIEDTYTHTYRSGDKVLLKCPNCEYIKTIPVSYLTNQGIRCPRCSDGISYPEKVMINLLYQLNIDFIKEYSKTNNAWCSKYRYDFYFKLNNEKYIVETNGMQHYKESFERIKSNRKIITLEEIQENDKKKKELAIKNGINPENYIVINCQYSDLNFIKNNILNSRLNEIFDLKNIDWLKIEQKSEKSLIKEVCNYWYKHNDLNNENITTTDLIKIFSIQRSQIIKYLKIGLKLGWCNYNPNEELIKGRKKTSCGKKIKVFKNGLYIGTFISVMELSRKSYEIFGEKLLNNKISEVLNNHKKTYKGYTFEIL